MLQRQEYWWCLTVHGSQLPFLGSGSCSTAGCWKIPRTLQHLTFLPKAVVFAYPFLTLSCSAGSDTCLFIPMSMQQLASPNYLTVDFPSDFCCKFQPLPNITWLIMKILSITSHQFSSYPTLYPETSWHLFKPKSRNFRPSAKLQVAKKETMMAVRGRVQLHSGHLGGQDGNIWEHVDVWWYEYGTGWVMLGFWALTTQPWRYETSTNSLYIRMKKKVPHSEAVVTNRASRATLKWPLWVTFTISAFLGRPYLGWVVDSHQMLNEFTTWSNNKC